MDEISEVTISRDHYERLERRSFRLQCLEDYGVDNWEGYSDALINKEIVRRLQETEDR